MADSDAVRSRRKRAHAKGDHHLCRHQAGQLVPSLTVPPSPDAAEFDARAELVRLAVMLGAAYAADPFNGVLAREWRSTLLAIAGLPSGEDTWADNELIRELSTPVYQVPPDWGQ